ncbi:MAG: DUF1684 domain-containing protein, partial [Flavisolibacter sp.]
MKNLLLALLVVCFGRVSGQNLSYKDSMKHYIDDYVLQHEVVKGEDKKLLHFYPVDTKYRIWAKFHKIDNSQWFQMPTSGKLKKLYKVYGNVSFELDGKECRLTIYQSQDLMQNPEYKDYLFLPFTDATSGKETYEAGRYIDLRLSDIQLDHIQIDFNKAYNPYCA